MADGAGGGASSAGASFAPPPASDPISSHSPPAHGSSSAAHRRANKPLDTQNRIKDEEEQWSLRDIYWRGNSCKVITQNANGPCSLIALCNILLLRGDLIITPPDRPVVSYSYLSELVADYLLSRIGDNSSGDAGLSLEAALSILPRTRYGLDVDVDFSSYTSFSTSAAEASTSPSSGYDPDAALSDGAGELALFKLCGVPLVHGWLPDPADADTFQAATRAVSYNRAADIVVRGDEAAGGAVVQDRGVNLLASQLAAPTSTNGKAVDRTAWSPEQTEQIRQAVILQNFLDSSATQLTYHGLFVLAQELPAGEPVALFRNSHVSVLYKRIADDGVADPANVATPNSQAPLLYTLVTDSAFLMEDEIVWESLVDVDGASSEFFDGHFHKADLRHGDYVGRSANAGATGNVDGDTAAYQQNEDADFALAMQIYQNDQDRAERRQRRRQTRQQYSTQQPRSQSYIAPAPSDNRVPNEVFTTMRYEPEPLDNVDQLVLRLLPLQLADRHEPVAGARGHVSLNDTNTMTTEATPSQPEPVSTSNPFLQPGEVDTVSQPGMTTAPSSSTNPFLNAAATTNASNSGGGTAAKQPSHRLYQHVPLLASHLQRLQNSAGAMCRTFSGVWKREPLQQQGALQADAILGAIDACLAQEVARSGPIGEVKGLRVGITPDGQIRVTVRSVTAFPSTVTTGEELAGRAPLPTVRWDTQPTRVRTLDLEPLVFNKTDARGFYEAAKYRALADPGVLSGVRPEDGRCFDVLLWNDEPTAIPPEATDAQNSSSTAPPKRLVTESSIANVIVEYLPQHGEGAAAAAGHRSRFVTSRTSAGMLDGLLRHWLVEHSIVEEANLVLDDVHRLVYTGGARLWLCNSLRGVWQVELVENLAFAPPPQMPSNGYSAGYNNTSSNAGAKKNNNKTRFSQLLGKGNSSTPQPNTAGTGTGGAAGSVRPPSAVHESVMDDLHGHRQNASSKPGKSKKGKDGKDKDCIIM
ncbi:hypothetical protein BCV70DRAFT_124150 [Testicularia cyperi]|uniref:MINDY deubiquitinase domain-containing protein n=1 Tax=Testicularia cyperi TaxID=1882483 RepID=A0A317XNX3_9BASI|nr:hypothetical protein BCV70DRAFT_124150 [Testicularia cyperi]